MASTNKTTNYELSQFEGTDKPSWEADYNADMLAIDTNLKAVSDIADGASGSISTLADRMTTAEGNITTNANDIDALEARADALEAGQTSDDSRLDAIEAEQIVQNTAIEGNTQLAYNIARPYDSASTYSLDNYALFQNTLYKCTTAVTTGEAFDPSKWEAIKVMDEIGGSSPTPFTYITFNDANKTEKYFTYRSSNIKYVPISGYTGSSTTLSTPSAAYDRTSGTLILFGDVYILDITSSISFTGSAFPSSSIFIEGDGGFNVNANSEMFPYFEKMEFCPSVFDTKQIFDGMYISGGGKGQFSNNTTRFDYYESPHFYFYTGTAQQLNKYYFRAVMIGKYNA